MEQRSPLSRRNKRLFFLLLIAVFVGLCQLAAVGYLKAYEGYDGKHLLQYAYDPYKNVLPMPNYVDTRGIKHNSVGFRRSTEVPIAKPAGVFRIFLVGGSTAYGLGGLWPHIQPEFAVLKNTETIDTYLERYLNEAVPGRRIEVINAAITSTWTHHHLIYLNQSLLKYDPDMVLFLDGFNDFYFVNTNHDQFEDYAYSADSRFMLGEPTISSLTYSAAWWMFRKFALARVVARNARTVKQLLSKRPTRTPINVDTAMAGLREVFPKSGLKMWRRSGLILKDEGIQPVFMLQPMLILERRRTQMPEVERKLFDFTVESYLPNYEAFAQQAVEFVRGKSAAMVTETGAEFIDLTNIYANATGQVFTDYAHLTPAANDVLARYVSARIVPLIEHPRTKLVAANLP